MCSANKIEAVFKNIEAGGVVLIDERESKGQSLVAQPGIGTRDVIKEDSVMIIDQEVGKPNKGSDVIHIQMETEEIDEVVDSTRKVRETMDHVTMKGRLNFARNIDKIGAEKIEGIGESQIEIAIAKIVPPSPTVELDMRP
ncbi:hypothetical protein M0R45_030240 [Rubus argutus]|uniref:Uncharacterized protein n=1 Tax=Rubus argutus TaxID=59490 RepID=A0AAW1WAX3_RUBAR